MEIISCQKIILQKTGKEFLIYLQDKILPSFHYTPDLIQQYLLLLENSTIKEFKIFFKVKYFIIIHLLIFYFLEIYFYS